MRFQLILVICTGILLLSKHGICADQWSSSRGSLEGRASLEYDGAKDLNEWHYMYKSGRRYETGLAVWASPVLAIVAGNPMAFIGGYDQTLHALDLTKKEAVWRKITNGVIQNAPAVGTVNTMDVVFWGSADRTVYAYIAFNGRQLWTRELIPATTTLGTANLSSPLLMESKLYITCFVYDKSLPRNKQQGLLFCLDMQNGAILWKTEITSGFVNSPAGFSTGGKLYVAIAARKGLLQCFDVSGDFPEKVWDFQMPHEVLGSPVVAATTDPPLLFLGSKFGNLIAINAQTGKEVWQHMAGNWIDNSACIGEIDGKTIVYVGSHDYHLYAFEASSGTLIWKRALSGEVYSAPCFFNLFNKPCIAAAALDNRLYILDAQSGEIITSYFTGQPIWDKIAKGETLWGSPAAFSAKDNTVIVHGSFDDIVYVLPVAKECTLTAMVRSSESLWWGLLAVLVIFGGVILPLVIYLPQKSEV